MSTTVRIDDETHRRLGELAEKTGLTQGTIINKALDEYERQKFFDAYDEAYAELREDEQAWKEEKQERELWENASGDGLEDVP